MHIWTETVIQDPVLDLKYSNVDVAWVADLSVVPLFYAVCQKMTLPAWSLLSLCRGRYLACSSSDLCFPDTRNVLGTATLLVSFSWTERQRWTEREVGDFWKKSWLQWWWICPLEVAVLGQAWADWPGSHCGCGWWCSVLCSWAMPVPVQPCVPAVAPQWTAMDWVSKPCQGISPATLKDCEYHLCSSCVCVWEIEKLPDSVFPHCFNCVFLLYCTSIVMPEYIAVVHMTLLKTEREQ